ncbi:MAG TPA: tyrosine-type recombinase/integrase [Paraburkholderia sp.]|uniref:tyrosine-type recombinase/integrase n=1 Tax=Paraburkholderia sp. TaxID=1926495 RepID=UPI002DEC226F|nr:tyrosine-type recombinase/integrase [Paraburkholderia sp.]
MEKFLPPSRACAVVSRDFLFRVSGLAQISRRYPQGCQQNLWKSFSRNATHPQSSVLYKFNRLDVYMLATLVRINELRAARWKEHINFKAATWFIPSDQAKNRKAITVHLSRFALRLLHELYAITVF